MAGNTATAVKQQPTSIDFVLTNNIIEDLKRAAVLIYSNDPECHLSGKVIVSALIHGFEKGYYNAEISDGSLYITPL